MKTDLDDKLAVDATCVSNDFLDHYMADANGDYVKVYLYILRHRGERYTVSDAADALNLTDNDIERAVRYWEKQGVFSDGAGREIESEIRAEENFRESEEKLRRNVETNEPGRRISQSGEETVRSEEDSSRQQETVAEKAENVGKPGNQGVSGVLPPMTGTVDDIQNDEEFAGILFVAKHVIPGLLTQKQVETLEYMYRDLSMNPELIDFLLEYCAGLGKTSARYLNAVALNWHEQNITTARQAEDLIKAFERNKNAKNRRPSKPNRFMNFESSEVDYDRLAKERVKI